MVLTVAKTVWACGKNSDYQLGIGSSSTQSQYTLAQVLKGDMNTPSDYIEYIKEVDAGWSHSLALDVNGFVWAWGRNEEGQLGNDQSGSGEKELVPIQVLGGEMGPASGP